MSAEPALQAVLAEVGGYESSVVALYRQAHVLAGRGQLSGAVRGQVTEHGRQLYNLQRAVYDLVVSTVQAVPLGANYVDRIPQPVRLPLAGAQPGTEGLGAAGLGAAVPALAWAAAVVVVIAAIAAIAFVLTTAITGGLELVAIIMQQRAESQRYAQCLERADNPEDCVSIAPPQRPQGSSTWLWVALGAVGVLAVGGLAWYGYRRYQGGAFEGLTAYPRSLGTSGLRQPALRRALAGGYQMEVE